MGLVIDPSVVEGLIGFSGFLLPLLHRFEFLETPPSEGEGPLRVRRRAFLPRGASAAIVVHRAAPILSPCLSRRVVTWIVRLVPVKGVLSVVAAPRLLFVGPLEHVLISPAPATAVCACRHFIARFAILQVISVDLLLPPFFIFLQCMRSVFRCVHVFGSCPSFSSPLLSACFLPLLVVALRIFAPFAGRMALQVHKSQSDNAKTKKIGDFDEVIISKLRRVIIMVIMRIMRLGSPAEVLERTCAFVKL